ncbi:EamA/RhaT family transporter [Aliiroseovarius marinus]|uniref:EamA/RhaT family transporter n=1 Tax=Aliiroseovarius marinus TaxID=2500159 RepID=UPI003D7DE099
MHAWIPVTLLAAFSQNLRFMLQKRLKDTRLTSTGATLARFAYSAPLVALLMAGYFSVTGQAVPTPSPSFFAFALTGGIAQILATICVVALFAERNFAVGITFKKTEVVLTALVGLVVLGEGVGIAGALAIGVGFLGLILLSDPPEGTALGWGRFFNRAAALGLGAGLLFSVSAIGYRGASLSLDTGAVVARAGFTLAVVTAYQTLIMMLWMALRQRGEIGRVFAAWRVGIWVGMTSMVGSFCWFTAFTLQNAALVKALGQVELLFSYAATLFVFREKVTGREYAGTALILASVLVLVLFLN